MDLKCNEYRLISGSINPSISSEEAMDKIKRHVFIKGAAMGARAFTVGGVAF